MMKRFGAACLSALLLVSVTACGGIDLTPEETEARLVQSVSTLPSTEIEDIQLTQTFAGEPAQYTAELSLIWNEEQGRFNTEKALEAYSRSFVDRISSRAPGVSELMLSWTVPFHSSEEPAMEFTYKKNRGGFVQSASESRFVDGSFGADAFIDPDAPVEVAVDRLGEEDEEPMEYRTPSNAYYIQTNLNKPAHKTELLPKGHDPMHKTAPGTPGGTPAWETAKKEEAEREAAAKEAAAKKAEADEAADTAADGSQEAASQTEGTPAATSGTQGSSASGDAGAGTASSSAEQSSDSRLSVRKVYVSKSGEHYHYDSSCGGETLYEAAAGEVQGRGLTPCEKCVS